MRAHDPLMPQLRGDLAAGGVHGINDAAPPRQRGFAIHERDVAAVVVIIAKRGRMIDARAFGNYQASTAFCAAPVIIHYQWPGNSPRRSAPRHGRHDKAIGHRERAQSEGSEQWSGIRHKCILAHFASFSETERNVSAVRCAGSAMPPA